jgi:hypothetical protein
MGENSSGFKVNIDWALIPDKAFKVLEGAIYDKPQPKAASIAKSQSWEELEQEIRQKIQKNAYTEDWLKICQDLAKTLGQAFFKSWFGEASLVDVEENAAILQIDTLFKRDYIYTHFRFIIIRAIRAYYPTVLQLKIEVAARPNGHARLHNGGTTTVQPITGGTLS